MYSENNVLDLCVRNKDNHDDDDIKPFRRTGEEEEEGDFHQQICKPPGTHLHADTAVHDRIFLPERHLSREAMSPRSPTSVHSMDLEAGSTSPTVSPSYITHATTRGGKATRPFKAYPKDPLSLAVSSPGNATALESNEAYAEFRRRMLAHVHAATGGSMGNKNMKRPVLSVSPTNQLPSSSVDASGDAGYAKDTAYWERRRKNNEAAKRSRDARRAKEDEIAIRAAFLEQENVRLKYEVAALRNETSRLRCMLYSS